MCDIIIPFFTLLCQNNSRRNILFFILVLLLVLYSLYWQHRLYNPYLNSRIFSYSMILNHSCPTTNSARLSLYNVSAPYKGNFPCTKTKTNPSTTVCYYSELEDMYISHDLHHTGRWEPQVADDLLEVLRRDPSLGLIDIGANVGYYTMLAAVSGHRVIAIEPNIESIHRIHQAVQIEGVTDRVTVVHSAVADISSNVTVRRSGDNQGDTRVEMTVRECLGSCPPVVPSITLDQLLPVSKFTSTVIKIDAQGFEHRAFRCAGALFDTLDVRYIFMEWLVMKDYYKVSSYSNETTQDLKLIEYMMRFFLQRHYKPHSLSDDGGGPLDPAQWPEWPNDIVWHLMPNDKEKSVLLVNRYKHWPR